VKRGEVVRFIGALDQRHLGHLRRARRSLDLRRHGTPWSRKGASQSMESNFAKWELRQSRTLPVFSQGFICLCCTTEHENEERVSPWYKPR
jgi:hypothetical protein